jgi:hypothetical protein
VSALILQEIITSNPKYGKPFVESASRAPVSAKAVDKAKSGRKIASLRVFRFLIACARADLLLRTHGLYRALTRLERRRRTSAPVPSLDDASGLMAAFKELRPWYPRVYLCLFDSIALLEFLASYRVFPRIVFGVVADPFQAHCWLQDGEVVINDSLERVRRYTPILCI